MKAWNNLYYNERRERLVRKGELRILLIDFRAVSTGLFLYYPRISQALPKLRAFIDPSKANALQTDKANVTLRPYPLRYGFVGSQALLMSALIELLSRCNKG